MQEHRISYGCINLPKVFYDSVAGPAFSQSGGIIYVLPEVHSLEATFPRLAAARAGRPVAPA